MTPRATRVRPRCTCAKSVLPLESRVRQLIGELVAAAFSVARNRPAAAVEIDGVARPRRAWRRTSSRRRDGGRERPGQKQDPASSQSQTDP